MVFCITICCLKQKFKHNKTIKPEEEETIKPEEEKTNKTPSPLKPIIDQESQRTSSAPPARPIPLSILPNKKIIQEEQQQRLPLPSQLPQLPGLQSQRVFMQTSLQQNLKPPLKSIVKTVTQNL